MSDIIYTPPASSGGTTINSNNNFIPVRQNATTFVDSLLFSTTTILKSVFSGFDRGLYFDYLNNLFFYGTGSSGMNYINNANQEVSLLSNGLIYASLDGLNNNGYFGGAGAKLSFDGNANKCNIGDGNGNFNTTYLEVDDLNQIIQTFRGNAKGLKLDFTNALYQFGDFNSVSSGVSFYIDEANSTIYTKHSGQQEGLFFDFVNDYFSIGDFGNTNNGTSIYIDDDNTKIYTKIGVNEIGLKLDFSNIVYWIGDYNFIQNGTYILIDDNSQLINFGTGDTVNFVGPNYLSATAGASSGQYLRILVNNNLYKIQLLNP
jgi:hypothetical protein